MKMAYERWSDPGKTGEFGDMARHALGEVWSAVPTV